MTSQPAASGRTIKVAVIAVDQMSPFHLWIPMTVFGQGARSGGSYHPFLCAQKSGPIETSDGYTLVVQHDYSDCDDFAAGDLIVVPTWHDLDALPDKELPDKALPDKPLIDMLKNAHQRGVTIVGLCLGSFVLGAAGLLDGQKATTHWAYADRFAKDYPMATLCADQLYVDEGTIVTSAGVAAGIDCCLHLMRRQFGSALANQVARSMVVAPHRDGGQSQFIARPLPQEINETRLADAVQSVRDKLHQDWDIEVMASRCHMSRRTFTRAFRKQMGTSFTQWLLDERLGRTQDLLESTGLSIEQIAEQAGFRTAASLRHHFRQKFKRSPLDWRRTFRVVAEPAIAADGDLSVTHMLQ
ncbi:Transcriptional regulator GlxA family, contains an amidase domain and an AraC-type DNA-binding HTH domain [Cohaesibacter sp. ES.047]|uniref:GlxA family transcriptional regulator n=1 Tax=Cohaesibacter sp. ES.047 TaxID=1798205 RepID=UPI000BB76768|nr:helix-turn-helix domain-containing protein [Cohaesibacter sp. ES.047]SNY92644.1 Transcriptional regulator GlxA family, contains an amidase domain and an AraC-type DNA-binding HTH domain [Cohaesibacter sp. ES.047]